MSENLPELSPWEWTESRWRASVGRVRAGRSLRPAWKGGARCAVALSFDCDHETFALGAGSEAIGRLSWGEFGRRVGVPRILSLLGKHGVPGSFFMPAVTALIDPDEPRRIVAHGHEIGLHGWIHENTSILSAQVERDLMMRARDTLTSITGIEPVGFRAAQWDTSPSTIEIVQQMKLTYDSSLMADEDCYELLLDNKPTGVIEIPVDWVRDDAAYLMFNRNPPARPYASPADVLDIFRREFELAYEERGLFQLVLHPFVIGYRSRIWILEEIIRLAKSRGGVWFATHAEIADWVKSSHVA